MTLCPSNGIVEDLCGVIGWTATCVILGYWSDSALYIPMFPDANHPLARLIGVRRMQLLCREYGGSNINVPADSESGRHKRNALIRDLLAHGVEQELIASITSLCIEQVRNIMRELEAAGLLDFVLNASADDEA